MAAAWIDSTQAPQQTMYYFDNNATTRVAPEVVDAMVPRAIAMQKMMLRFTGPPLRGARVAEGQYRRVTLDATTNIRDPNPGIDAPLRAAFVDGKTGVLQPTKSRNPWLTPQTEDERCARGR